MRHSALQKFILKLVYARGPRCTRTLFLAFYKQPTDADVKIITRSIERLIEKGLLIGFGHKTAEKWFTETVTLTPTGRAAAKSLFGKQQRLPFRKR